MRKGGFLFKKQKSSLSVFGQYNFFFRVIFSYGDFPIFPVAYFFILLQRNIEVIFSFQLANCGGNIVFPHATASSLQSNFH